MRNEPGLQLGRGRAAKIIGCSARRIREVIAGFKRPHFPCGLLLTDGLPDRSELPNDFMNEAEIQRQKEIKEAEELLFTGPQALGFAKGLFLGSFVADWVMPYP